MKDHDNRKCNIAKQQSTFCLANYDGKISRQANQQKPVQARPRAFYAGLRATF
jgi:hypothetical protein